MPNSGKIAMGRSAVTSISTASVTHHVAIQTIMPSVARPGEFDPLASAARVMKRQQMVTEQPQHWAAKEAEAFDLRDSFSDSRCRRNHVLVLIRVGCWFRSVGLEP